MKNLLVIVILISSSAWSQSDRYITEVFSDYTVANDVVYGLSHTQSGEQMVLKMDIYQPKGDKNLKRPLVILAHGGYFFFGDKDGFAEDCKLLAKSGFVAVSINYRLIDVEDDSFKVAKRAVIDAVADMKASVRYFYKDATLDNQWKIDTNNIFIGGWSAGAITSLHYAYANTTEDVLMMGGQDMLKYVQSQGGLEGRSGNQGYSSKIRGVINIAGSLFDAKLVDKNEAVLFSIHGTEDMIVPFESGLVGTTKVTTEGSGLIHKRADKIGLINQLVELDGLDHFGFIDCKMCYDQMRQFISNNLVQ